MRPSPETELPLRAGVALLVFPALALVAAWLGLVAGVPVGLALAPAAAVLALVVVDRRPRAAAIATFLLVVAASLLAASVFYDVSWDGQAYHQEAILALAGGWNPYHDAPLPSSRPDNIWINHYPMGAWLVQAALLRATGALEATKALTLILAASAGLLSYAALAPHTGRRFAALVSLVLAGHPVVLAQAWSFYVDGMVASLLTALLALAVLGPRAPRWTVPAQAAAMLLLINLKFTGLVYGALVCAAHVVPIVRARSPRAPVALMSALVVGSLAVGYHPYVSNTVAKSHPFYPIHGPGSVDFLSPQLVPEFHRRPRAERFAVSLFSRSSDRNEAPVLKAPWSVNADELAAMGYADTRIAGFGPLFAAALLAAVVLLVTLRLARARVPPGAWVAAAAIVLATAINPALWWARYVPQLWLLPAGLLAVAAALPGTRHIRAARAALLVLLLGNQALVVGAQLASQRRATRAIDEQLDELAGVSRSVGPLPARLNGFDALEARLRARGVPVIEAVTCPRPLPLVASPAQVCLPRGPS